LAKSYIKRSKEILLASRYFQNEDSEKVIADIMEMTKKRILIDRHQMEKEIELFIKKNEEEMHKSTEELRDAINKEAKYMEGYLKTLI